MHYYGRYPNGFRFDSQSHLADFTFFQALVLPLRVRVKDRLGLRIRFELGLGFIFLRLLPFYYSRICLIRHLKGIRK